MSDGRRQEDEKHYSINLRASSINRHSRGSVIHIIMLDSETRLRMNSTNTKAFSVGSATFGDGRLTIIAGPCVVESAEHAMMMARECARRARDAGLDYVFKSSFDKANRSSIKSFRGIGMDEALKILQTIKTEVGVPVLTDIHDVSQVERVAEVADILQIPAFLCRQTDLIAAAVRTGRIVNLKKGQFLSPSQEK